MANDVLAKLFAQTGDDGASLLMVRTIAEEASVAAVDRALQHMGLSDPAAIKDIHELRDLLAAWRDAKRTARNTAVSWCVKVILPLVLMVLAVRFGFSERLTG